MGNYITIVQQLYCNMEDVPKRQDKDFPPAIGNNCQTWMYQCAVQIYNNCSIATELQHRGPKGRTRMFRQLSSIVNMAQPTWRTCLWRQVHLVMQALQCTRCKTLKEPGVGTCVGIYVSMPIHLDFNQIIYTNVHPEQT